jgi:hypothetical protein
MRAHTTGLPAANATPRDQQQFCARSSENLRSVRFENIQRKTEQ